jgi:alpha-L-fucosidase 2
MNMQILFDQPSMNWDQGLPLGNGRLGAVVTGGLQEKHIILNEETVWYGGPRDRNNPDAIHYMGQIREQMRAGRIREAQRLAVMALTGTPETQRHYSTLGLLVMDFFHHDGPVKDYQRALDLETAVVTEHYLMNNVDYWLTAFASSPDQVIGVRVRASQPVLQFSANIERGERVGNFSYGTHEDEIARYAPNGVVMRGTCGGEKGLIFRGALFGAGNGDTRTIGDKLVFENASEVTLYIAGGTNYEEDDIESICVERCRAALAKGFDACLNDHIAEWSPLFNNVSINLQSADAVSGPLAMNRVFDAFEKNDLSAIGLPPGEASWRALDDYLTLLLFAFGRYILLGSSRNCALPANLQGIWCQDLLSIWDGKFTTNINLEMNYWPADSANLSECFEPYIRMAERIHENGQVTARSMYGCRGFVLHNNTDLWADTAVQDAGTHCSYWFLGGVWIAADLWEHYRYTRDIDFLARVWPILRDALLFVLDFMEESNGELVMGVTTSPENAYYNENGERVSFCRMSAMDSELIGLLMRDCLETIAVLRSAGRAALEIPAGLEEEIQAAAAKLAPVRIGQDGAVLEWGIEVQEVEPGHRHQSHVIGAYPYNAITEKEPELFAAVRKAIEKKIRNGGANTGWSRAWAGGLMARLGDGNAARDLTGSMARYSGLPNLFSCCNIKRVPKLMDDGKPMQIDGNLGTVQAVIEMLLQSHNDEIRILPALPDSWKSGSFRGLVARGNVVVDAEWEEGCLARATVTPRVDGNVVIVPGPMFSLYGDHSMVPADSAGRIQAHLSKGQTYRIERKAETPIC